MFTAPFTGIDFHSSLQAVGSVYFSELHNITQERRHMWSWMKGICRSVGQLVSSVVTVPVVREFKYVTRFIPLVAEVVLKTDGYRNVS